MDVDLQTTKLALGTLTAWAATIWGILKYFATRLSEVDNESQQRDAKIMESLTEVERKSATKSDVERLGDRLSEDARRMEMHHDSSNKALNARLDALMTAIIHRNEKHGSRGEGQ